VTERSRSCAPRKVGRDPAEGERRAWTAPGTDGCATTAPIRRPASTSRQTRAFDKRKDAEPELTKTLNWATALTHHAGKGHREGVPGHPGSPGDSRQGSEHRSEPRERAEASPGNDSALCRCRTSPQCTSRTSWTRSASAAGSREPGCRRDRHSSPCHTSNPLGQCRTPAAALRRTDTKETIRIPLVEGERRRADRNLSAGDPLARPPVRPAGGQRRRVTPCTPMLQHFQHLGERSLL
jgi:hypothetical protein